MPLVKLIADSGATKTEWCLLNGSKKTIFITQGMSPYFISAEQMETILITELKPRLKKINIDEIYYYGTGCSNPGNVKIVRKVFGNIFPDSKPYRDQLPTHCCHGCLNNESGTQWRCRGLR